MIWVFPDVVKEFEWFKGLTSNGDSRSYTLSRGATYVANAHALARIASEENAILIHTHFSFFDVSSRLAQIMLALKFRRLQLVWHVHSAFTENSSKRRMKDFLKLGILGRSCHMVPVSSALGQSIAERGCPRKHIHVVDNGIDIAHATERRKTSQELRTEWQIPNQALVLLGFGWTPIRKGVDSMLEALAVLRNEGMEVVLIVAGTEELKQFIDDWPDQDSRSAVRVIPPAERVGELFAASDIFLSPSRAEGWCYSVAEAMLNGVPVVAARVPALAYAENWPGVHFCQVGNGESLAASIRQIAALSEAERKAQGEMAMNFVSRQHSAEHWAGEVWNLYEQILGDVELRGLPILSN